MYDIGAAFESLSLVDLGELVPIFATLTVVDPFDDDTYMQPPIDVPYQEPLWLAAMRLSDFMDDTDYMDASFPPLPSPLLLLSSVFGAPVVVDPMDIIDDMDLIFSPLPSPLLTPLPFAPGVPVVASPEPVPMYLDSASPVIPLLPAPMPSLELLMPPTSPPPSPSLSLSSGVSSLSPAFVSSSASTVPYDVDDYDDD
ncbi:hypothetical protein O0I10_006238 [Lichtheimia ornata]|uniref:Uncharacterized protein n=1 Tax=Lichtheimia ornata TaxID=688661 RepID=A0AAD7Y112_9FUNG|nr:uncharacterized protein O0I10_006238 [Lichtheimia ornata]KAJ8657967.1 hypothetical protein O0I10_006238 [Lichtheimia ornata]